ncbi:MAG: glycosyl hydrolase family 28-related protein [Cyclobacteriaceae bacterium]
MTNKNSNENRRDFLRKTGFLSLGVAGAGSKGFTKQEQAVADGPYNVLNFGAKGDGKTIDTKAIQNTIDKAAEDGGGTVYFPAGTYISGTLFLKSNITIHLEAGV